MAGYQPVVSSVLARALHAHARSEEGIAVLDRALSEHPEASELRLEQLLLTIPVICAEARQVQLAKDAFSVRMGKLERHLATAPSEEFARLFERAGSSPRTDCRIRG